MYRVEAFLRLCKSNIHILELKVLFIYFAISPTWFFFILFLEHTWRLTVFYEGFIKRI